MAEDYLKYLHQLRQHLMDMDYIAVERIICYSSPESIPEPIYKNILGLEDFIIKIVEQLDNVINFFKEKDKNGKRNTSH